MYERSAIVLERYMEQVLELDKNYNVRKNNENYRELIIQVENYQIMTEKVLKVIQEFEDTVRKIDDRAQLFTDLG